MTSNLMLVYPEAPSMINNGAPSQLPEFDGTLHHCPPNMVLALVWDSRLSLGTVLVYQLPMAV